jgi:hypothetical protein
MKRHALTIAQRHSAERFALALVSTGLIACSSGQATPEVEVPSEQQAWLLSACTAGTPDFGSWSRDQHGALSFALPPGYKMLKGPPDVISLQGPARRATLGAHFVPPQDARQMFDFYRYRARVRQNVCRGSFGGYPADVVGSYDKGRYGLVAMFEPVWGGANAGKFLYVSISSPRLEEARELRTVLHSIQLAEIR